MIRNIKGKNRVIIFMMMKRGAHNYILSHCVFARIQCEVDKMRCLLTYYRPKASRQSQTMLNKRMLFHLSLNTKSQTGMKTITHKSCNERREKKNEFLITRFCDVMAEMATGIGHQIKRMRTDRIRKTM